MTTLNPIEVSQEITQTYTRYLKSLIHPDDPAVLRALENAIEQTSSSANKMVKGPFFELTPSYKQLSTSRELIAEGELAPTFAKLESEFFSLDRSWYAHQVAALRQLNRGRNVVVATGTGSGKTESFLLPILNSILSESPEEAARPGVRALLLYPMNALANDQLKRLRQLLKGCPEITFGRYTGETRDDRFKAIDEFRILHHGETPLPNELLSREEMQSRPPHLLLTNYAMLEYLLLRPDDSSLFGDPENSTWKFIVVDEAHMYDGAIGAEIGYLIRRLRSRVSHDDRIQCVATSATLGSDPATAAKFASNLFGVPFDSARGDIVVATAKSAPSAPIWGELPANSLVASQSVEELYESARASDADFQSPYEMLAGERTIREFISLAKESPQTLGEVSARLTRQDLSTSQLRVLIDMASKVVDEDGIPLVSGKYHLFARATEGAFVCQNPHGPHISLSRYDRCPDCDWQMFELAACQRCGGVHLGGLLAKRGRTSYITQKDDGVHSHLGENERIVWLGLKHQLFGDADDDDLTLDGETKKDPKDVKFCPKCGRSESAAHSVCSDPSCGSRLIQAAQYMGANLERCLCCGAARKHIVRRFESGNDAAASVLATALYQKLPPASREDKAALLPGGGRKLLVFSDSRQQAAFFAPYLEQSYQRFIQRRFIYQAICDSLFESEPGTASDIAEITRRIATNAGYFPGEISNPNRRIMSTTWVQAEVMTLDQRISLEGSGLVTWEMKTPADLRALEPLHTYGFAEEESVDLLQILVRSLRLQGAVGAMDYVDLTDGIFAPRLGPIRIRSVGSDPGKKILSWLPTGSNASGRSNARSDFLDRVFATSPQFRNNIGSILEGLWRVLTHQESSFGKWLREELSPQLGPTWSINPEQVIGIPASNETSMWRCKHCGTISYFNVRGVCPRYRCPGSLQPVGAGDLSFENDHYRHLYNTLLPIPLVAKEHTAQWTSEEAARIQQDFIRGKTNILSCSTTFELGVDVGDLQSVLLRNVPPTVSNYTQRAGRAGRRSGTASLVLTYAQRRSHDLSVFAVPANQIGAPVRTPVVPITNPRLAQRHFFSVALAAYWKDVAVNEGHRYKTADDFFARTEIECSAANRVPDWLDAHRDDVESEIRRIVKTSGLAGENWDWHEWTENLRMLLSTVEDDYQEEIGLYGELQQQAFDNRKGSQGDYFGRVLNTLRKRPLLGFLANRNLIPKYGFPVDTVEFKIPGGVRDATKLDLARDLSQAIFEYAPGAEIVAGGRLWKSIGIARQRERENPAVYYRICKGCDAYTESIEEDHTPCPQCGTQSSGPIRKYFEPRFGFVASTESGVPGDAAPRISWRGETRIARDGKIVFSDALKLPGGEISFEVMERVQLVRLNPGPADLGFKVCRFCAFALPGTAEWPKKHTDPVRSRDCSGYAHIFSLAHKFETDVVRIFFPFSWDGANTRSTSLSVLYAILQGAVSSLQIAGSNIDGAVTSYHTASPTIDIVDTVPGGAGYARLIGSELGAVLEGALQVVKACECGPETSCSMCLRSYLNQRVHDDLVRGAAADYLSRLFQA